MIIVRIVQFVKIVQLVQLDYYGYIKFFGVFVGTWVGAFTLERARMQVVLGYLNGNKKINSVIAAELLGVEVKTASRLLSKAEKLEILKGDGKTKNKVYSVL